MSRVPTPRYDPISVVVVLQVPAGRVRLDTDSPRGSCRLELGAGGGLVGLAVASQCGVHGQLVLTDQQEMLELMRHNIGLNNLEAEATAMVLNWCVFRPCISSDISTTPCITY